MVSQIINALQLQIKVIRALRVMTRNLFSSARSLSPSLELYLQSSTRQQVVMAPKLCALCAKSRAILKRPKTGQQICKECFFYVFETEVHNTISQAQLFKPGDRVAIGASGGKGMLSVLRRFVVYPSLCSPW